MRTDEGENRSGHVPRVLHRYFWEYDAGRLTVEESRHTILRRLLEVGGWDAVRWLRSTFTDDELRDFLVRRQGRGVSPRRLRFWGLILGLPREQVSGWMEAQRSNPWARRRGTR